MNNERFDDMTTSFNKIADSEDEFVQSWKFDCVSKATSDKEPTENVNTNLTTYCQHFYKSKTSYFASCFSVVDPEPFYDICVKLCNSKENSEKSVQNIACISGVSYIEACSFENIPLRVPDSCIK
jgi:hypothetical protein